MVIMKEGKRPRAGPEKDFIVVLGRRLGEELYATSWYFAEISQVNKTGKVEPLLPIDEINLF